MDTIIFEYRYDIPIDSVKMYTPPVFNTHEPPATNPYLKTCIPTDFLFDLKTQVLFRKNAHKAPTAAPMATAYTYQRPSISFRNIVMLKSVAVAMSALNCDLR